MAVWRRKVRGRRLKTWNAKFEFRGQLYEDSGFPDRDTAQHWIDTRRTSLRRGEVGYVRAKTATKVMPLVEDYVEHLRVLRRVDLYCYNTEKRLTRLANDVPWMTIGDIKPETLLSWRASRPKWRGKAIGPKTLNQYLDHAQQFCDFLVQRQLIPANPLASLARVNAPVNEGFRRAATTEEIEKLIKEAPAHRARIYAFTFYIPLRRRALKGLEWRDLELDGDRPTLTLRAELSKNGKSAKLAIRADLAAVLKQWRGSKGPEDHVFGRLPGTREMKKDLAAAGVAFDDGKGQRRFDLHAFRKSVIRILKKAGVQMADAHVFLQHRDPRTTQKYYDDDLVAPEITNAAEKMPALDWVTRGVVAQTVAQQPNDTKGAGK